MVARLTPDQKAACSSHVGVNVFLGGLINFLYIPSRNIADNLRAVQFSSAGRRLTGFKAKIFTLRFVVDNCMVNSCIKVK